MIYANGPVTLICGDAYQIVPSLGRFDAMITDPQYKFNTSGGGQYRKARKGLAQIEAEGLHKGFDVGIINPLQCPAAVVFCHNDQLPEVSTHLKGNYHRFALCHWRKSNPQPVANKHYRPDTELYLHAWLNGFEPTGTLEHKARSWDGSPPSKPNRYGHATPKPEGLMEKILANVPGERILDPFMGTGTTGVAAIRDGRTFVGIEHNRNHFDNAVARLQTELGYQP